MPAPHKPAPHKRTSGKPGSPGQAQRPRTSAANQHEVVDPAWLLRAFSIVVVLAIGCGYATMCLLFDQGAWQLVLHPLSGGDANAPRLAEFPAVPLRFDVDQTGKPQLSGWKIPAEISASRGLAVYLRGGSASLQTSPADATDIRALHDAGFDVLAFDYRGYGSSAPGHPTQARMQTDADAAYDYAADGLKVDRAHILIAGEGLGAALAAQVAEEHGSAPGLILFNADASAYDRVRHDPRGRILPVSLLFHDRFNVGATLLALPTPKLLISAGPEDPTRNSAYNAAASPKRIADLPAIDAAQYTAAITRFADEYLPGKPAPPLAPAK